MATTLTLGAELIRTQILALPALSLTGFAKPLRDFTLKHEAARVLLDGSIQLRTLAAALEFLPAMAALQRGLLQAPAPPPRDEPDAGAPPPDSDADDDEAEP